MASRMTDEEKLDYTFGLLRVDVSNRLINDKLQLKATSLDELRGPLGIQVGLLILEKHSRRLFWATVALVGLTFVLGVLTGLLAYRAF
jgi:hypothetical protein